jgi:hypothetical protein
MKKRTGERHTTFFNLTDALAETGCAFCVLTAAAAHRYLEAMLYEYVNDPGTRKAMATSLGFCPAHARLAREARDALGVAILYEALCRGAASRIRKGHMPLVGFCPVCRAEADAEQRYVRAFSTHIVEKDFEAQFLASDGFCLSHFQSVCESLADNAARELVRTHQAKTLETLAAQLRLFAEKHDYRNTTEFGPEGDAWQRALEKLAGKLR